MKYYLIAGEASGDLHASNLMRALKLCDTNADFRFYGGDKMAEVGGILVKHYRELAYMGFIPVLLHLRTILCNMRKCKQDISLWRPDVVILVDYPGFNLDIARFVKSHTDIPVYYYISPKIWAWKEYRIKNIRRDVDELFSILPFEVDFFKKHHYSIHYVGNPCVDAVYSFMRTSEGREDFSVFCKSNGLTEKPVIAVLAGSRRQEIKDNLRCMLAAAARYKDYQVVIAGAPGLEPDFYRKYIPEGCGAALLFGQTYRLLRHSAAALVTSGTATLETAILRVPQVVCYYTACGRLVSLLRRLFLKVPYISLVNLIADKEVVPELVADRMTLENLVSHLGIILPGGKDRDIMLAEYDRVNAILGSAGASERAAKAIVNILTT
ncbi:MAG: lipid-A-disaccharide synthase [Bacteroides sp.]|nr:lipid-A-disaccharide synthase [Roseburia sp.]MCM1346850.1 lipid-A-disaccharide synthase [Bacteroides sp.]MCM1419934.1 lipid-A-disaccharide synthase [Bacteroides sp.]